MKRLNNVARYWEKQLKDSFSLGLGEEVFFPKLLNIAKKSSTIIEIGLGKGRMARILRDHGVCAELYGIDISNNKKNYITIGVKGDARMLPFRNDIFDLVYSLGVIEHFPETRLAVLEHSRIVRKGGYVLITTPHLSVFTPIRYLVYLLRDRKMGTFEETRGRNLRLNKMKKYFVDSNLLIEDYGFCGIFGMKKGLWNFNFLQKFQRKNFIGAYLYIIGKKQ